VSQLRYTGDNIMLYCCRYAWNQEVTIDTDFDLCDTNETFLLFGMSIMVNCAVNLDTRFLTPCIKSVLVIAEDISGWEAGVTDACASMQS